MSKVKTELYEINKPSELCQVIYYNDYEKGILAKLTAIQVDLLNSLLYHAKKVMLTSPCDISTEIINIEIPISDITTGLNKYSYGNYDAILQQLYQLKKVDVMVNTLGKVKNEVNYTLTSFIHKLTWTKHRDDIKKKIKIGLDGEVIRSFIDRKKFFSKMYLAINYSLVSKYSKLLYEILKDYEGIKKITINYDNVLSMMNVNTSNKKLNKWYYFNRNILEKAISEINEKSDIKVSYESIKEKPEGERLQVTKIKFFIEKQPEERLQELGLINPPVSKSPLYFKSKTKLDKLVKGGYNVIDPDMWIEADIRKNETKYNAELRLDVWLKETDQESKNDVFLIVATQLECADPMITIENYQLKGIFSQEILTNTAVETLEAINKAVVIFLETCDLNDEADDILEELDEESL